LCALGFLLIKSWAFVHLQLKLVVVGALGGRFDHEAANINVLHTFAKDMQIVLLSEETSLTVLPAGHMHEIHVDCSFEGPHCGLVPIGAPSLSTTSTGLRWNLSTFKTPSLPSIFLSGGLRG
jgi:thiamine pyrophosphokinase